MDLPILSQPVVPQVSLRSIAPTLVVGAALLWIFGMGRYRKNPSRRRGSRRGRR